MQHVPPRSSFNKVGEWHLDQTGWNVVTRILHPASAFRSQSDINSADAAAIDTVSDFNSTACLGWTPEQVGIVPDIERPDYYRKHLAGSRSLSELEPFSFAAGVVP